MFTRKMMNLNVFALLVVFPTLMLGFKQNLYRYVQERGEIVRYNTSYISELKVHNFKYNRTQAVFNVNVHFVRDLPMPLSVIVQAYRFASNEYRLFPIRFAFDFCLVIKTNDFGLGGLTKNGNFTTCPIKKGQYYIRNFVMDGNRMPPLIPEGRYRVDSQFLDSDAEIMFGEGYGKIEYPII